MAYEFEQQCACCGATYMARDTRAGTPLCRQCSAFRSVIDRQVGTRNLKRTMTEAEVRRLLQSKTTRVGPFWSPQKGN